MPLVFSCIFLRTSVRNCILQGNSLLMNKYVITEKNWNWRLLNQAGEVLYSANSFGSLRRNGYNIYDKSERFTGGIVWHTQYNPFNPTFWRGSSETQFMAPANDEYKIYRESGFSTKKANFIIHYALTGLDEMYCIESYGFLWLNKSILNSAGLEIGIIETDYSGLFVSREDMQLDANVNPLHIFVMHIMCNGVG